MVERNYVLEYVICIVVGAYFCSLLLLALINQYQNKRDLDLLVFIFFNRKSQSLYFFLILYFVLSQIFCLFENCNCAYII